MYISKFKEMICVILSHFCCLQINILVSQLTKIINSQNAITADQCDNADNSSNTMHMMQCNSKSFIYAHIHEAENQSS